MMGKHVAILGAGPSGLVAAKSALECGLKPMVLEKAGDIGGIWQLNTGAAWQSMRTISTHYNRMFSDFTWDHLTDEFPTQEAMCRYLKRYMTAFSLESHLKLNCTITNVNQSDSNKWKVSWFNQQLLREESDYFDYVIVATGCYSHPYIPPIAGLDHFQGQLIHAKDYKSPQPYQDKTIIVIGNGVSGAGIVCDIAKHGQEVINLIRRPIWMVPRYIPKNASEPDNRYPIDLLLQKRAPTNPSSVNRSKNAFWNMICKEQASHEDLKIDPNLTEFSGVTICDDYLEYVKNKKIIIKRGNIKQIDAQGIVFAEGGRIDADTLIFCTGYQLKLPFFDDDILTSLNFDENNPLQPLSLYKGVFHPNLPNMAFIAMSGAHSGFGVIELQARWATMTFAGHTKLPLKEEMLKGIEVVKQSGNPLFSSQPTLMNYVSLIDGIAAEIGVLPDFDYLKKYNQPLYKMLWEGSLLPAHYRLYGFASKPELAYQVIERAAKATMVPNYLELEVNALKKQIDEIIKLTKEQKTVPIPMEEGEVVVNQGVLTTAS